MVFRLGAPRRTYPESLSLHVGSRHPQSVECEGGTVKMRTQRFRLARSTCWLRTLTQASNLILIGYKDACAEWVDEPSSQNVL